MEIRSNDTTIAESQQGVFATKFYAAGDVIYQEAAPLIRLAPTTLGDERLLVRALSQPSSDAEEEGKAGPSTSTTAAAAAKSKDTTAKLSSTKLWQNIRVPSTVAEKYHGTFKGMVQAALCWLILWKDKKHEPAKEKFLQLYSPCLEKPIAADEESIVAVARQALQYLQENMSQSSSSSSSSSSSESEDNPTKTSCKSESKTKASSKKSVSRTSGALENIKEDDANVLLRVMLIWACNSFEQGRVYDTISRFNHSCNPNAIVQTYHSQPTAGHDHKSQQEGQRIVAATNIGVGDEICISYLGLLLYAETTVRRSQLQQTKHFTCRCARCLLYYNSSQDGEVGGDQAAAVPCFVCHARVGRQLDEDTQYDDEQNVKYAIPKSASSSSNDAVVYTCESCQTQMSLTDDDKYSKYKSTMDKVVHKVTKFLLEYDQKPQQQQQHRHLEKNTAGGDDGDHDDDDDDEDDEDVQDELLEQHLSMSSSVLGAKHWTTNLLMLLQVDRNLQSIHGAMLTAGDEGDSSPDMDRIAATVDSLERILRFVTALDLHLHHGHITGEVIIGLARALVALGDKKSQTYAAEWLDKIEKDYVARFCSPGLQKVVHSLQAAWQQNHDEKETTKPPAKKAKR